MQSREEALEDACGVCEVFEQFIGTVRMEFAGGIDAGGDRGRSGSDRACAADVGGCIADDPDGVAWNLFIECCLYV